MWHTKTNYSPAAPKDPAEEPSRTLMHVICYTVGLGFNITVYPKEMPLSYPDPGLLDAEVNVKALMLCQKRQRISHHSELPFACR